MLFIVSLAIFTIILTITENLFLAMIALFLLLIWTVIVTFFTKKWKIWQKIWIISLAFVLSLSSIFVKVYRYDKKVQTISTSTWLITENMEWPQWSYFIWTWIISDIYSYQKYIFQDGWGREYFLKSEKSYKIWDEIRLNWYVSFGYTWAKDIFNLRKQLEVFKTKPDFQSIFQYEFNYPKREMMKWYYWTIYEQNSVKNDDTETKISFIQKIRKNLQDMIISAYWETPQAWLVLGMLVWDRSQIPSDDYQTFIDSWLVHIIAVSGWNIVMIVVFLSAILFFIPFYPRNAIILLTVIVYSLICGLDSSVFRAAIMWSLSLLALFRWREIDIRRAMWTAFVIMLLVNPYFLAYDVWFLLSFSAIIWIVYFSAFVDKLNKEFAEKRAEKDSEKGVIKKSLKKEKKSFKEKFQKFIRNCAKDYIEPTLWATLWVLPIMLFFMWWTNLLWIVANFFVSPIIAIVMIYGFISTILFNILPRNIFILPEKWLIDYIYRISWTTAKFGIYLHANWAWIVYVLLILFILRVILKEISKKRSH